MTNLNDPDRSPWQSLLEEAANHELPTVSLSLSPGLKQTTATERLSIAYLKGTLPLWIILAIGGLIGTLYATPSIGQGGVVAKALAPALAILFTLPWAWLLAPLWHVRHLHRLTGGIVTLAGLGFGCLAVAPGLWGLTFITNDSPNSPFTSLNVAIITQSLLEGFLQTPVWILSLLAAFALWKLSAQTRLQAPWLEIQDRTRIQTMLATLTLVIPFLTFGFAASIEPRLNTSMQRLAKDHPASKPSSTSLEIEQKSLWNDLSSSIKNLNDHKLNRASGTLSPQLKRDVLTALHRFEEQAYEHLRDDPAASLYSKNYAIFTYLMAAQKVDYSIISDKALAIHWAFIRDSANSNRFPSLSLAAKSAVQRLAHALASQKATASQQEAWQTLLQSLQHAQPSPEQIIESSLARNLRYTSNHLIDPQSSHLVAFGHKLSFSLPNLVLNLQRQAILKPYFQHKQDLDFTTVDSLIHSIQVTFEPTIFTQGRMQPSSFFLSDVESLGQCFTESIQIIEDSKIYSDYLTFLQTTIELRKYKTLHGSYPLQLSDLPVSSAKLASSLGSFTYTPASASSPTTLAYSLVDHPWSPQASQPTPIPTRLTCTLL